MHVAFVSQPLDGALPPPRNSIGILTTEFARHLAKHCRVTVFSVGSRLRGKSTVHEGVEFQHVPAGLDGPILRLLRWCDRGRDPRRPPYARRLYYPGYALKIARALRKQGADVVHIWNNSQFIPVIRRLNPRIVIALHMECEWLTQLDLSLLEPRLAEADLIIGCSDFVTEGIRKRFPGLAERCKTVYNGVDVDRFAPGTTLGKRRPGEAEVVLYVGRISPEKGSHVLIDAFARVAEKRPEARLELAGVVRAVPKEFVLAVTDDPLVLDLARFYDHHGADSYRIAVQERIQDLELEDRIVFRGDIPNTELPAALRSADVFVFPSVWEEPFGIPPVEAMAAGLPVVATRSGGMNETILDGVTGFLVERDDPEALADALIALLSDPGQRAIIGQNARKRALALFSYEALAGQLLDLYRSCQP